MSRNSDHRSLTVTCQWDIWRQAHRIAMYINMEASTCPYHKMAHCLSVGLVFTLAVATILSEATGRFCTHRPSFPVLLTATISVSFSVCFLTLPFSLHIPLFILFYTIRSRSSHSNFISLSTSCYFSWFPFPSLISSANFTFLRSWQFLSQLRNSPNFVESELSLLW